MGRSRRSSRTSKVACLQLAPLPVSFLAQPAKHDATRAREVALAHAGLTDTDDARVGGRGTDAR
eukprot:8115714-Alexandrium_andersonii.AAC.1